MLTSMTAADAFVRDCNRSALLSALRALPAALAAEFRRGNDSPCPSDCFVALVRGFVAVGTLTHREGQSICGLLDTPD